MDLLQTLGSFLERQRPAFLIEQLHEPLSMAATEEILDIARLITAEYEEETLRSMQEIDRQRRLPDMVLKPNIELHRTESLQICQNLSELLSELSPGQHLPVCKEEVSSEEPERNPGLAQEEPQVKGEEIRETESLVSTSTEMERQANADEWGVSQPRSDDQFLFSQNNIMNCDEWEENRQVQVALKTLKSRKRKNLNGQILPLSKKLKSSKQSKKERKEEKKKSKKRYKISIPVICTICDKSVYDMNSHMEIHTGRKYFPYRCRICAEGFQHKADYWPHLLKCMHCFHGTLYTGM